VGFGAQYPENWFEDLSKEPGGHGESEGEATEFVQVPVERKPKEFSEIWVDCNGKVWLSKVDLDQRISPLYQTEHRPDILHFEVFCFQKAVKLLQV